MTGTEAPPAGGSEPQASFVIALPPGWLRLPAREAESDVLDALIDGIVADALPDALPRDSAEPWRGELRKRLTTSVIEAREAGATAVYLPVRPVNGVTVPASIIESEIDDEGHPDSVGVLAAILNDPTLSDQGADASLRSVDGAPAARTDRTIRRVQRDADWPEVTTRQVVYTIEVPHREGRWIVLSFSAVSHNDSGSALSDALATLFDALVSTFRFTDVPGVEHSDLERRLAEIASL